MLPFFFCLQPFLVLLLFPYNRKARPLESIIYELPILQILFFIFMHVMGGMGASQFKTSIICSPNPYSLSPIPFIFILLRTLLRNGNL